MNKKVILTLLGIGLLPVMVLYLFISDNTGKSGSKQLSSDLNKEVSLLMENVKEIRSDLLSEISLKNTRYIEGLLKKTETDVSVLKFQAELMVNKKDKNFDYVEGLAKRSFTTNPVANRVFIITGLLSRNYNRSGISGVSGNDKNTFFKLADSKNNPSKKIVWSDIYSDTKGNKMVSCVVPLYRQNKLEGVVGIEINTDKLTDKTINKDFKYKDSYAFILSQKALISYSARSANDLKLDDYKRVESRILKTRNGKLQVRFSGIDKTVFFTEINPVKWIFCLVVPNSEVAFCKGIDCSVLKKSVSAKSGWSSKISAVFLVIAILTVLAGILASRKLALSYESEISHLTAKLAIVNQEVEEVKKQMKTYDVVKDDKQKLEDELKKLSDSISEAKRLKETSDVELRKQKEEADTKIKSYEKEILDLKKRVQELQKLKQGRAVEDEPATEKQEEPESPVRKKTAEIIEKVEQNKIESVVEKQVKTDGTESIVKQVKEEKRSTKSKIPENQLELTSMTDDVLIVEAQEGNLRQARNELYRIGYSVHLARGASDALDKISTTPYKFVVMDATMVDDEKKKVRQSARDVIVITSSVDKEDLKRQINELVKKQQSE